MGCENYGLGGSGGGKMCRVVQGKKKLRRWRESESKGVRCDGLVAQLSKTLRERSS